MTQVKHFFWSDLHLGHHNMYKNFTSIQDASKPMRPFKNAEEADAYMIDQYNKLVGPNDKVYFIGDVAIGKKHLSKLDLMKPGYKYLVMGNHDNQAPIIEYNKYFNKIYGTLYMRWARAIVTHVPVHPWHLDRWEYNFHGHLHDHKIPDDRYINMSVEHTNYRPILLEELGINYKP